MSFPCRRCSAPLSRDAHECDLCDTPTELRDATRELLFIAYVRGDIAADLDELDATAEREDERDSERHEDEWDRFLTYGR